MIRSFIVVWELVIVRYWKTIFVVVDQLHFLHVHLVTEGRR